MAIIWERKKKDWVGKLKMGCHLSLHKMELAVKKLSWNQLHGGSEKLKAKIANYYNWLGKSWQ